MPVSYTHLDTPLAQQLDVLLQRLLDILRVMVLAIEDDQILQAPGDEQLTLAYHAQIAGAQPALAITLDEGLGGRFGVAPVALGDARPGDPDLTDLIVPQHLKRLRDVYKRQSLPLAVNGKRSSSSTWLGSM